MKAWEVPICLMMIDINYFKKYSDDLFKAADTALYKAKESGKNCICFEN